MDLIRFTLKFLIYQYETIDIDKKYHVVDL